LGLAERLGPDYVERDVVLLALLLAACGMRAKEDEKVR
jgi:hypothetical protein